MVLSIVLHSLHAWWRCYCQLTLRNASFFGVFDDDLPYSLPPTTAAVVPTTEWQIDVCRYVCPLELDTEYVIDGVKVTFLEANHCPGAALIHFRLSDGKTYLHTGDFRASKSMQLHPLLQTGCISLLYLDTTYCNPKYKSAHNLEIKHFLYNVYFANLIAVSDFHHRRMLLILLSGQLKGI